MSITKMEKDIGAVECMGISSDLLEELKTTLERRGIKDLEDWKAYVRTIERNGEVLAEICGMLDTTVLQLQEAVKDLQRRSKGADIVFQGKEFYIKEKYQGLERKKIVLLPGVNDAFDWTMFCRALEAAFKDSNDGRIGAKRCKVR
ncbi:unnamed protein product [Heligmosomoides polygyrus]|uniref:TIR-NBS-LRR resistance protein n=1 Tax=Heligmosomoides polygyrus TaxID=6339 RepID=A0A183F978_HELPZ|nr:unnamed protein product [Heligmosomoides polygyrus]